jgi:hypothetical protein
VVNSYKVSYLLNTVYVGFTKRPGCRALVLPAV